jgi:hypothetical protein
MEVMKTMATSAPGVAKRVRLLGRAALFLPNLKLFVPLQSSIFLD